MSKTAKHGITTSPDEHTQICYTFEPDAYVLLRPRKALIEQIYEVWIQTGETPPGVTVDAIIWGLRGATQEEIRQRLREHPQTRHCPGIVDRYGAPNLTLCDYDSDPPTWDGQHVRDLAEKLGLDAPEWIEYSRTRRGYHMAVKWTRDFDPAEIVALQLLLGSDPARERYNLMRALTGQAEGNPRWNLLFERKI